jgi:hypothetical protein
VSQKTPRLLRYLEVVSKPHLVSDGPPQADHSKSDFRCRGGGYPPEADPTTSFPSLDGRGSKGRVIR